MSRQALEQGKQTSGRSDKGNKKTRAFGKQGEAPVFLHEFRNDNSLLERAKIIYRFCGFPAMIFFSIHAMKGKDSKGE